MFQNLVLVSAKYVASETDMEMCNTCYIATEWMSRDVQLIMYL